MAQVKALITPEVITWARKQSRYSVSEVALKLKKPDKEIEAWESGKDLPSIAQARELSKLYKRPLAVFYLPEPPEDFQTLRDYRKFETSEERQMSTGLAELVRVVIDHQIWTKDFLVSEEVELDYIGMAKIGNNIIDIADAIRRKLGVNIDKQIKLGTRDEVLRYWLAKVEEKRIFVVRAGGINPKECRGFVISDKIAPFIFLNSNDAKAARLFTLAHELAHLWINKSGISNLEARGSFISNQEYETEQFCNAIASEVIMPNKIFNNFFEQIKNDRDIDKTIEILSGKFKVSEEVVARRLLDLNQISREKYEELREYYSKRWLELKEIERKKAKEKDGGPSYYVKTITSNGLAFTQIVIGAYSGGKITGRDASALLNVKINNFKKLSENVRGLFVSRLNFTQENG